MPCALFRPDGARPSARGARSGLSRARASRRSVGNYGPCTFSIHPPQPSRHVPHATIRPFAFDSRVDPTMIHLPERVSRLHELAYDLWWSWNTDARNVFRRLDYPL